MTKIASGGSKGRFQFNIGAKLGLMSGVGIALVVAMLAGSMYSGASVKNRSDLAMKGQIVAGDIIEMKASLRGMMIGLRDMMLASSAEDTAAATEYFAARQVSALKMLASALSKVEPDIRVRLEKAQAAMDRYAAVAKEITVIHEDSIARAAKRTEANSADVSGRVAENAAKIAALLKERARPIATEIQLLSDESVASAKRAADDEVARASQAMESAGYLSLGIGTAVILILIGSAIFGSLSIARPLARLVPELKKFAGGDFNVAIPGIGRKDEIGQIADAAEMIAERVGSTITNIKVSASEVTNASTEISTSTMDLSQRTEEQAASLEETSASMEEMTATVRKNADNAKQASDLASSTRVVADHGGEVVARTVIAMGRIEESSRKITDIIGVIDEIARQTNLLALNAAVEAARAGDAGRGFAVVASEVRSLAQRSSQAAKDIKDLITSSNGQVKDGVELVNKAGASLKEIVESIQKVTVVVSEIANASAEQSTGIEEINKALTQMDEVTQQNSALVEENAATAKTLEGQARSMDERVAFFRLRTNEIGSSSTSAVGRRPTDDTAPRTPADKRRSSANNPVAQLRTGLAIALDARPDWD